MMLTKLLQFCHSLVFVFTEKSLYDKLKLTKGISSEEREVLYYDKYNFKTPEKQSAYKASFWRSYIEYSETSRIYIYDK